MRKYLVGRIKKFSISSGLASIDCLLDSNICKNLRKAILYMAPVGQT